MHDLGERYLYCEGDAPLLFTENETNNERIFGTPNPSPYVKDGINNYVVQDKKDAVNPEKTGTKSAAHYQLTCGRGKDSHHPSAAERSWRLAAIGDPFKSFAATHADPPQRGGRVLSEPSLRPMRQRRCSPGHAPGVGRDALDQAIFLFRRGQMARGARCRSDEAGRARTCGTANGSIW